MSEDLALAVDCRKGRGDLPVIIGRHTAQEALYAMNRSLKDGVYLRRFHDDHPGNSFEEIEAAVKADIDKATVPIKSLGSDSSYRVTAQEVALWDELHATYYQDSGPQREEQVVAIRAKLFACKIRTLMQDGRYHDVDHVAVLSEIVAETGDQK